MNLQLDFMHRLLFIFGLFRVVISFKIMHLTDLERKKKVSTGVGRKKFQSDPLKISLPGRESVSLSVLPDRD